MKMITLFVLASILALSAKAEEMTYAKHLQSNPEPKYLNKDRGHEVLLEAQRVFRNDEDYVIILTTTTLGRGTHTAALEKTPAFIRAFENMRALQKNNIAYMNQFGAGRNGYDPEIRMWVKTQPAGYGEFVINGNPIRVDKFKVLAVCKEGYVDCKEIDTKSGLVNKLKGLFN